jgi:hypothetical protein
MRTHIKVSTAPQPKVDLGEIQSSAATDALEHFHFDDTRTSASGTDEDQEQGLASLTAKQEIYYRKGKGLNDCNNKHVVCYKRRRKGNTRDSQNLERTRR